MPLSRFAEACPTTTGRLRWLMFLAAFSLAYFLAAKVGIATALPPEGIVVLWPANAIVLAALVTVRRDTWWQLFLVTLATEVAADVPTYPFWAAVGYGLVNFSEAALVAFLLGRLSQNGASLVTLRDFVRFLAIGPVLASGTAALFGAAIYKLGNPELDYLHYWRVFWLGDALGLLVVGTAWLAWRRPAGGIHRMTAGRIAQAAALSLGLVAVSGWVLLTHADTPTAYLIFPLLMWAAWHFGVRGASLATLATAAIAIGSTVTGHGPFVEFSEVTAVLSLQGLIAVVALSTLGLAFSTEDSQRLAAELKAINRELDETVAERTEHLRHALDQNELLLREIYHRVKNNLQLISSVLSLHSRNAAGPELRSKLAAVQTQIGAIATTYDVLQHVETVERVDVATIVGPLCQGIQDAHAELVTISCETRGEVPVAASAAVALALAVNELIINSIKHAKPDEPVAIQVRCERAGDKVRLRVSDDGTGFPPGFDLDQAQGFGIQMTNSMVTQAGGRIRVCPSTKGAEIEIVVPAATHSHDPQHQDHHDQPRGQRRREAGRTVAAERPH